MNRFLSLTILLAMLFGTSSMLAQEHDHNHDHEHDHAVHSCQDVNPRRHLKSILKITTDDQNFSTLVSALTAAGLKDSVLNSDSLTLFAPINAAFENISSDQLNNILEPSNVQTLRAILNYHILPGINDIELLTKAIELGGGATKIKTLGGETLTIYLNGDVVMLKDNNDNLSSITQSNVDAKNGVIHIIDAVVFP